MKVIQDLWICQDSGLVVFHRVFHEYVDANLFGGFMSALNAYSSALVEGGLSSFEIEQKRFTLFKKSGYIFISSSSRKVKENKVIEELNNISDRFFGTYPAEFLANWCGDVSAFTTFEFEIQNSLQEVVKKFQKAFW
ncbi:MAG TPA: hypothetical protein VGB37_10510 [Candidatus Lokiarchaeia archaeon]